MTGRLPGLLTTLGVLVVAAGITAGAGVLPVSAHTSALQALPRSVFTPTLICPGPETLQAPAGGTAVSAGAAVMLSGLVASTGQASAARLQLLGRPSAAAVSVPTRTSAPAQTTKPLPTPAQPAPAQPTPAQPGSVQAAPAQPSPAQAGSARAGAGGGLELEAGPGATAVGALAATALGPAVLTATAAGSTPAAGTPAGGTPAGDTSAGGTPAVGAAAGDNTPVLAATQSTLAWSGALRGLATTTCSPAQSDSWLVGGGTVSGERLRLLLANPAATAAVVDVDVRGPAGSVPAPSGNGVVVPPSGEVPLFIDALAPGLARVAVHVTTRSGRVRASLHDSLLRGLAPGGTDDVPVAAPASKHQVMAGISVLGAGATTASDPTAPGSSSVRIVVPGAVEAVARLRLIGPGGPVDLPHDGVVGVPAGGVVDVPLSGVPDGTYTAEVDADVPVVAGAQVGRGPVAGQAPASDFGWAGSLRSLTAPGYAVLPAGAHSALSLVATKKTGSLSLTEIGADGTDAGSSRLEVAAGTSQTFRLDPATVAVRISAINGGAIAGSILAWATDSRGTLISVLPLDLSSAPVAPSRAIEDSRLGLPGSP